MKLIKRVVTGPPGTNEYHSVAIEHYASEDDFTHQVKAFYGLSGKSYKRAKTFKGETAWSDAERYYDDIYYEIRWT